MNMEVFAAGARVPHSFAPFANEWEITKPRDAGHGRAGSATFTLLL